MKIVIAAGLYPPDIGGPSQYAKNLYEEFARQGHVVSVAKYTVEKKLPGGISHFIFFIKVARELLSAQYVVAMDTFSVGVPALFAAWILRKKSAVRISGDFLWEAYVERTGNLVTLQEFYAQMPSLSLREKIILFVTKRVLALANALVFTTEWQRDMWVKAYDFKTERAFIIENFFRRESGGPWIRRDFIWATRPMKLKNGRLLYRAFAEARKIHPDLILDDSRTPYEETLKKIKTCYAVILPSISDVSPNLILDAIAYGKPFIVTTETGYKEKFKNIGLFVNPKSEQDIIEKILILADSTSYNLYQQKVAGYSLSHSYADIALEFLRLYSRI